MARPIRINIEGGYYHVINRGRNKGKIFRNDSDYKKFLRLLSECYEQYKVHILAYCLMPNHYHLLIRTPYANLPQCMRQLNGVYTQIFNRKYHHDGSLFRGRYKAIIIQEEFYLMRVIRYIHLNPKKAGIEKRLGEYDFSSHKDYINKKHNKLWLKTKEMLKKERWVVGSRGLKAYMKYMEQEEDKELETFYKAKKIAFILGKEDFVDRIQQAYLHGKRYYNREVPQEWRLNQQKKLEEIEKLVLKEYNIKEPDLFGSIRGKDNEARKVTISLIRNYVGIKCEEIAKRYQVGNPRSISEYCRRIKMKCLEDKGFNRKYEKLKSSLQVET